MTNATKAAIIAVVNAALGVALAFDLPVTDQQMAAINVFVNAALGVWVALTYKDSAKRLPDTGVGK